MGDTGTETTVAAITERLAALPAPVVWSDDRDGDCAPVIGLGRVDAGVDAGVVVATLTRLCGGGSWHLSLVQRAVRACSSCGQELSRLPGPVEVVDPRTGTPAGSWDHQHRCGSWQEPVEVTAVITEGDDVAAAVEDLWQSLRAAVADERQEARDRAREELADMMRDARRMLADGEPDSPVWWDQDSGGEPTVWEHAGALHGWAPDPTSAIDDSIEIVESLTAEELRTVAAWREARS